MNEGRGVNNIVKDMVDYVYDEYLEKIKQICVDDGVEIVFDLDENIKLKNFCVFIKSGNGNSGLNEPQYSFFDESFEFLNDAKITIIYKDVTKIKELLSHEFNHLVEYYFYNKKINKIDIKNRNSDKLNISGLSINLSWIDISFVRKELLKINKSESFERFLYLVYLSLDGEMNSRISQVYHYLYDTKIVDEDLLFDKIRQHENWNYYLSLKNFDFQVMCNKTIDEIGEKLFIEMTKTFREKLEDRNVLKKVYLLKNIPDVIEDIDDVLMFYKTWANLFDKKSEKHLEKFKYIIKEVVEDLKGNRPYNEHFRKEEL